MGGESETIRKVAEEKNCLIFWLINRIFILLYFLQFFLKFHNFFFVSFQSVTQVDFLFRFDFQQVYLFLVVNFLFFVSFQLIDCSNQIHIFLHYSFVVAFMNQNVLQKFFLQCLNATFQICPLLSKGFFLIHILFHEFLLTQNIIILQKQQFLL